MGLQHEPVFWSWLQQAGPTVQMGLIVVGLLLAASVIARVLTVTRPDHDFSELTQRIRSWWFMAGFFFLKLIQYSSRLVKVSERPSIISSK